MRLRMTGARFHEWLGRRLGSAKLALPPDPATRPGHWEDRAEPHFSAYKREYPLLHPAASRAILSRYRRLRPQQQADIVFLTAISGRYDTPKLHEHLMPDADYVLYSDVIRDHALFHVRPFPYFNVDPVRTARFIKTHPHLFAQGYKVAVWVDGNVVIRGDLSAEIDRFMQSGMAIGAMHHPLRSSVYDELLACLQFGKDDDAVMEDHVTRYFNEGFDSSFLIESNLMMFRLDHPELPQVMNRWWGEIERGSRRDQLSLPYALEKCDTEWHPITPPGVTLRNHPKVAIVKHAPWMEPVLDTHTSPDRAAFCSGTLTGPLPITGAGPTTERRGDHRGRRMDVVVCVHNALDCVQRCLQSVAKHRDPACHRIIVVNDGSAAETSGWLREFQAQTHNCQLIEHATAKGYTRAANAGMAASDAEALVLLNSDTEVAPRWIEKLFDTFDAVPGIGIVGPLSNAASHQSIPDHRSSMGNTAINALPNGYDVARMDQWCEASSPAVPYALVPLVHGFCFAVRRTVREAIGLFDEQAFPFGYGEENDFCLRAANAGFLLAVALNTFVFHEKSRSFESARRMQLMQDGADRLRAIHGTERVANAVGSMRENPAFVRMRALCARLERAGMAAAAESAASGTMAAFAPYSESEQQRSANA